jgi:type VI secretion system protein ImpK
VVLKSDELFHSGSARLDAALHPVILRIGSALDKIPGTIVITGHTDDVPIRTARFPSNWELSTERARSVVALMASKLREPGRLRAEGVADSEPVAPNDNAANRAKNRRVAILLRTAP